MSIGIGLVYIYTSFEHHHLNRSITYCEAGLGPRIVGILCSAWIECIKCPRDDQISGVFLQPPHWRKQR